MRVTPSLIASQLAAVTNLTGRVERLEIKQGLHDLAVVNLSMAQRVHQNDVELFELAVALKDDAEATRYDAERKLSGEGVRKAKAALAKFPSVSDDLKAAKLQLSRARKELARLQQEAAAEAAPLAYSPFAGLKVPGEQLAAK
jgi:hypothetical protein